MLTSSEYIQLSSTGKIKLLIIVNSISAPQIKGWLFNFYFIIERYNEYVNINYKTLQFQKQIIHNSSAKEIEDRDKIFINNRRVGYQI